MRRMDQTRITIAMSESLRIVAEEIAQDDDISLGQLIRDLLSKEISRRRNARPPVRADEQLVAPLRARLASDLAHATSWDDLQSRLRTKGFVLREAGGGLALHAWPSDQRVCKASDLGFSYSRLMQRLGAAFPGHAHHWLAARFCPGPAQNAAMSDASDDGIDRRDRSFFAGSAAPPLS